MATKRNVRPKRRARSPGRPQLDRQTKRALGDSLAQVVRDQFDGNWFALAARLREHHGLAVTSKTVRRWSSGRGIELPDLIAIARLPELNLSIDWLLTGEGPERRGQLFSQSTTEAELRAIARRELAETPNAQDETLEGYLAKTPSLVRRFVDVVRWDVIELRKKWWRKHLLPQLKRFYASGKRPEDLGAILRSDKRRTLAITHGMPTLVYLDLFADVSAEAEAATIRSGKIKLPRKQKPD